MTEEEVRRIAENARRTADVVAAQLQSHVDHCCERHQETNDKLDQIDRRSRSQLHLMWGVLAAIVGLVAVVALRISA